MGYIMKSIITMVITTFFISLSATVFAEGGYRWEKNAEKREMSHKMSMNSHMEHSSSEHGSMMKGSSSMGSNHVQSHGSSHAKDANKMQPVHSSKVSK